MFGRSSRSTALLAGVLVLAGCVRVGYDVLERPEGGVRQPVDGGRTGDAGVDAMLPMVVLEGGTPPVEAGTPPPLRDGSVPPTDGAMGGAGGSPASKDAAVPTDAGDAGAADAGDAGALDAGEDVVEAAADVEIGQFVVSGAGCPSNKTFVDLGDRAMRYQLNFQAFGVTAGVGTTTSIACDFALPLTAPALVSLRMVGGNWQGDYSRSASGSVSVEGRYSFDGADVRSHSTDLTASGGTFLTDDDVREAAATSAGWTACSRNPTSVNAQARLTLRASNTVTVTIRSGGLFRIESRYCEPP